MKRFGVGLGTCALMSIEFLTVTAYGGSLPPGKKIDFSSQKNSKPLDQGRTGSYRSGPNNTFSVSNAPIVPVQPGLSDSYTSAGWSGEINSSDLNVVPDPAPEPSTLLLFGSGLLIGAALLRSKRRSH
jgi:hypothetical protein